jgi:hypothetical protein
MYITTLGIAKGWAAGVRFGVGARCFSLLCSVQTGFGAYPRSYPVSCWAGEVYFFSISCTSLPSFLSLKLTQHPHLDSRKQFGWFLHVLVTTEGNGETKRFGSKPMHVATKVIVSRSYLSNKNILSSPLFFHDALGTEWNRRTYDLLQLYSHI